MKALPFPPALVIQKEPPEVIGLVQGRVPGSIEEWYVSRALDKLGIEYMFQYSIFGGRGTRGGLVIDFVCYIPKATPVFVQGLYWHNNRQDPERQLSLAAAQAWFKTTPIELWENEVDTFQKALATVKKKVAI